MPNTRFNRFVAGLCVSAASLFITATAARAQSATQPAQPVPAGTSELSPLEILIRDLQAQVQALNLRVNDLQNEQRRSAVESSELRRQLSAALGKRTAVPGDSSQTGGESALQAGSAAPAGGSAPTAAQERVNAERLAKVEENQEFLDAKITDQYQTKVESGSKYRMRLSGIVLLNVFGIRGNVDNIDFPQLATEIDPLGSKGSFGGSLRQSQIGLEVFGPDIAGAHTSADVKFDFAGGFSNVPNGFSMGLVRLRTGTIRFDWAKTSLVAGQDYLFFAPVQPSSLVSLATPAFSYAGQLWGWTPQVRVEHHIDFSDSSSLQMQGGILDSLSADFPPAQYGRYPTWGEQSGQPAYAARVALTQRTFGQRWTLGFGGHYGRQGWGLNRHVDGWVSTTDLTLPLGNYFEFSGAFYRGRAVGGLGGGIGQTVLMSGAFDDPATKVQGLDSTGGWVQLKFKPKPKLEVNGAFGQDNPFARQLAKFSSNPTYLNQLLVRNRISFVNFIYQPRSDFLFSVEFRRLRTHAVDGDIYTANHINFSMGYIF